MSFGPWPLVLMLLQVMLVQYALPEFARGGEYRNELVFAFLCPLLAALGRTPRRPWLPWAWVQFGWVFLALGGAVATFVLPLSGGGPFLALALWQILPHMAVAGRRDRLHAALCVIGPTYVLFEMSLQPHPYFGVFFPAVLLLALLGANRIVAWDLVFRGARSLKRLRELEFLEENVAERFAAGELDAEEANALLPGEAQFAQLADRFERETGNLGTSLGFLQTYGVVFVAAVLLVLPFLALPLLLLPEPVVPGTGAVDDGRDPRIGLDAPRGGVEASTGGGGRVSSFPEALHLSGRVTRPRHHLIARITAHRGDGAGPFFAGPLHLRGLVLDRIGAEGVEASRPRPVERLDADDGEVRDGFTWIGEPRAWEPEDVLVLGYEQQALRVVGSERAVVFAAQPAFSINKPRVWYDPDGSLLLPASEDDEWLRFQLAVGRPSLPEDARRAVLQDHRWLQLPDDPLVARMGQRARELVADAGTDRLRVARIVQGFQSFDYDPEATSVPGFAGMEEFLDRRRGYCAYFAVAATIQLRSLGIPARVATGFHADTYDEEEGASLVDSTKGHVWIEVAFADHGWVPFDPTPTRSRASALAALGRPDGVVSWSGDLATNFFEFLSSGDRDVLRDFAATLGFAPAAFARNPVVTGLLCVTIVTLLWGLARRLRRRRKGPEEVRMVTRRAQLPASYLSELLAALARRGVRREPHVTLREFARAAALEGGPELSEVPAAIELFYRERFGGRAATGQEEASVRFLAARLTEEAIESQGGPTKG